MISVYAMIPSDSIVIFKNLVLVRKDLENDFKTNIFEKQLLLS